MTLFEKLEDAVPRAPGEEPAWDRLEALLVGVDFARLRDTPQNPVYHAEGDVFRHTQMVCRALTGAEAFFELPRRQRTALFLAALLHDVGKITTTKKENGAWAAPNHSSVGAQRARVFLWRECGLCGSAERMQLRETICALIRYHMLPLHWMDRTSPERTAREVASVGALAPDFSWELLCMLAAADARGRKGADLEEGLLRVELCRSNAEECGCLNCPFPFPNGHTMRAYLDDRINWPEQPLYDDSWGEVVLLSGLPGTGKDTWIRENLPGLPVVSLDEIRAEHAIRPSDPQGEAARLALSQAKVYLRSRQPFVWNATDLSAELREKQIRLFERYGARVRIVYLETAWETRKRRNADRARCVPEHAAEAMLEKTVPPMPWEAQCVSWIPV